MGAQEKIQIARTLATSIEKHAEPIKKYSNALEQKADLIKHVAGGTRSGDVAVTQTANASSVLSTAGSDLLDAAQSLESYASKLEQS